jgi:S-layer homology domain
MSFIVRRRLWLSGLAVLAALTCPVSAQTLTRGTGPRAAVPRTLADGGFCGPTEITHSATQDIVSGNSVTCVDPGSGFNFETHFARAFDLVSFGIDGAFAVCEVEVAVEAALSVAESQPLSVYLYWTESGAFPGGVLTPIGQATVIIPDQDQSYVIIPVTGTAPPGSELVVDVASADGSVELAGFLIGSNADGQTGPGYITAPSCGIVTPTDLADVVGGEDMHIVVNVRGDETDTALAADPLRVDAHTAAGVVSNLNGVFETGETVQVETSWSNPGDTAYALTGNATSFDGPPGPTYAIPAGTADYGMVAALATSNCFDATGGCFQLQITGARPAPHWDATLDESVTLTPLIAGLPAPSHAWTLHVGESFPDVPTDNLFYAFVETIFHNGVTGGCAAAPNYCPGDPALRKQMAVFVLRAKEGPQYVPPPATGVFNDVPMSDPFAPWIEELFDRGVVAGCGAPGGPNFCPNDPVLRQQMPVFLLRTLLDSSYTPPVCTGLFDDVPCPGLFSDWIEDLFIRGIAAGCGGSNFCPTNSNTRGQMAPFLTKTFGLTLYGP